MFLPPINSSPRVSSQKSSFSAVVCQPSRFAKGSIEIHSATSQTDSPKLNVVDTPKTLRRMSCMSTLTPIDPSNSPFKATSPGSTQSSISAISNSGTVSNSTGPVSFKLTTRRNSSLSFKCLESLTKNKRMSIQLNPNQLGDLYAQNDSIILEQAKEEGEQIHTSTKKDAEKLSEMASLEKTSSSIQVLKDAEKAFELADQVFTAYGIHARPYTDFSSDSAMTLLPITNKRKLANFYRLFIPEMRRFNFTFLSNLRVGAISICDSLKFSDKHEHHSIIEKKLYSGLFVLDRHMDETTVQQHWFRIVIFHFLKAVPEFFEEWCDLIKEDPKKKRRTAFEELLTTFNHLMGTSQREWNHDIYLRTRVSFLEEALRQFDFDLKDSTSEEETCPDVLKFFALWR